MFVSYQKGGRKKSGTKKKGLKTKEMGEKKEGYGISVSMLINYGFRWAIFC